MLRLRSRPSFEQWAEPGWVWPGDEEGTFLPTCMKAISRSKPPPKPAGIRRCSEATLAKWRADNSRYPPYQYFLRVLVLAGLAVAAGYFVRAGAFAGVWLGAHRGVPLGISAKTTGGSCS